jgi:acetyl-CoA C-acetyltransferase
MTLDRCTPVLIGVGQVTARATSMQAGREPADLMAEAIELAVIDAGLVGVPTPDSIRVVRGLSWRYGDPARAIAERLGISAAEYAMTPNGGNCPQSLVNTSAVEITNGTLDLAILTGGESWRTRSRYRAAGVDPPWTAQPAGLSPDRIIGTELDMSHPGERALGIVQPVQVYPMFETAIRAAAGESVDDHQVSVSELWARFSAVAATNPYAWSRDPVSAEGIRTAGPNNRMVSFPYPKLMNSNNDVDQAAALLICSVERARSLGVPSDRWVFIHAGADCHEQAFVSNRWTFSDTPAVRAGARAALDLAGIGIDDIEIIDLYSCFPSAVQLGAQSLGISLDRQLTRTGGLTFAGGPWNNYVMHSIATVVTECRQTPGAPGFVWANGGFVTKHAFGVYSTNPPAAGFRHADPQHEIDALPRRELAEPADAAGPATVEAYAVMYDREGYPASAHASLLLADGRRAWGTSTDGDVATALLTGESVGAPAHLAGDATMSLRG